jgi:hypothetical protein
VKVECRSRRVGERRDVETPPPPELKLSGEKQTKKGVKLRGLSFSRQPTCPRSFERRLRIQLKICSK